jgi:hypothetical protein
MTFNVIHALETPVGSEKYGYLLPGIKIQAAF